MLVRWIIVGLISFFPFVYPQTESTLTPTAVSEAVSVGNQTESIEYTHPEKSFKMLKPSGWEIKKDYLGYAVFMEGKATIQPSAENPVVSNPNITVAVVKREVPLFMDGSGLEQYEKEVYQNLLKEGRTPESFQIFSKSLLENLPGGRKGLLYYIIDRRNSVEVMMAILVVATDQFLYRITLNDYKVSFDKNLDQYYQIMTSVETAGVQLERPSWVELAMPWIAGFFGFTAIVWAVGFQRRKRWESKMRKVAYGVDDADPEDMGSESEGKDYPLDSRYGASSPHDSVVPPPVSKNSSKSAQPESAPRSTLKPKPSKFHSGVNSNVASDSTTSTPENADVKSKVTGFPSADDF